MQDLHHQSVDPLKEPDSQAPGSVTENATSLPVAQSTGLATNSETPHYWGLGFRV